MQDLIDDLFLDNPCIQARLSDFLNQNPGYLQMREKKIELERELTSRLPRELQDIFLRYEESASALSSMNSDGSYLFGLGLRQDLREALWKKLL